MSRRKKKPSSGIKDAGRRAGDAQAAAAARGADRGPCGGAPPAADCCRVKEDAASALDLKLKGVELWVKRIGIAGALVGFLVTFLSAWNLYRQGELFVAQQRLADTQEKLFVAQEQLSRSQQTLAKYQAEELEQKRRVNLKVEAKVEELSGQRIRVHVSLTNESTREVSVAMVGVQIWDSTWAGEKLDCNLDKVIFVDNVIAHPCPPDTCPPEEGPSKSRTRGDDQIFVAVGETHQEVYGPYMIPDDAWRRGLFVEVFVLPAEQGEGRCVVSGPPACAGDFPRFCAESLKDDVNCAEKFRCIYIQARPPQFKPAGRA